MLGQLHQCSVDTLPETTVHNIAPKKNTGKGDSYWKTTILGAMLVSEGGYMLYQSLVSSYYDI